MSISYRMLSYRMGVLGGSALGIAIATLFATRAGLTPLLWLAVAAFAVATSLFLAAMTKVVFGGESFAFLHYQLAAIATTAVLLPEALNLLALALAIAQAIGRLGCATAGCCYGRRGIPVQRIESAALFVIAVVLAVRIESAFVIYILASATTRFTLEYFRGDTRRHFLGISEAQWICLISVVAMATWQRGFAIVVAATTVLCAVSFRRLALVRALRTASNEVRVVDGIRISHGVTANVAHYTISSPKRLTERRARSIARLIGRDTQLIAGADGIYHVLIGGHA